MGEVQRGAAGLPEVRAIGVADIRLSLLEGATDRDRSRARPFIEDAIESHAVHGEPQRAYAAVILGTGTAAHVATYQYWWRYGQPPLDEETVATMIGVALRSRVTLALLVGWGFALVSTATLAPVVYAGTSLIVGAWSGFITTVVVLAILATWRKLSFLRAEIPTPAA